MPLYIVGFAIVVGLGALLWRRYQSGGEWQRDASFFVDLLAMGAAALIVGTLALTQLKSDPFGAPVAVGESVTEPSPSPEPTENRQAIVPSVTLTPRRTATQRAQGAATLEATSTMTATATVSSTVSATVTITVSTTVAPAVTTTAAATASQVQTYVVQPGDRLNTIAARFGLTSAQIIAANPGLNADTLQIDQRLIIPTSAPGAPPPAASHRRARARGADLYRAARGLPQHHCGTLWRDNRTDHRPQPWPERGQPQHWSGHPAALSSQRPPDMKHFDAGITFCYTDNLARTAEWYERVMGLELAVDQGKCRIYRVAGQGFLGFCERAAVGINHDDVVLTFVTDDVDAWYDRLRSMGAIVSGQPETSETFGIYHFYARDPNGYRLEVQRFLTPAARRACHNDGPDVVL